VRVDEAAGRRHLDVISADKDDQRRWQSEQPNRVRFLTHNCIRVAAFDPQIRRDDPFSFVIYSAKSMGRSLNS
jgi:hypothetical protein